MKAQQKLPVTNNCRERTIQETEKRNDSVREMLIIKNNRH